MPEPSPSKKIPPSPPSVSTGAGIAPSEPSKKSKLGLLFIFGSLFLFLIILFLVFLVLVLFQNGGNNPLLGALGIEPALLKQLLITLISLFFGFLSLVSFILFLLGVFRRLTSAKAEVEKKKQSLILAVVSGVFGSFAVFVWILLYFYLARVELGGAGAAVILSDPENTTNLTAPVSITFTAQEIERLFNREGVVSYAWDLDGDGAFDDGNGRDIQYSYTTRGNAEGIYNVALKTILGSGKEVVTGKLVTIANVLPSIVIEYRPEVLEVPVEVTFDASKSRDPDGSLISYDWDFNGDGQFDAQGAETSWSFTEANVQDVLLKVTDNNGQSAEETLTLDFKRGKVKEALIIARPGLTGEAPYDVALDGSNSFIGERIQSYEWDFGDQSPTFQGRLAQHRYEKPGEYTVTLRVEGADGGRYETTVTLVAERPRNEPKAVLRVTNQTLNQGKVKGAVPFELSFSGAESSDQDGKIVEYRWDFDGDGSHDGVGEEITHIFADPGVHQVILTVIDDDDLSGTAEITVEVTVPEIEITVDISAYSGPVPLEVTFDASSSRTVSGEIISYEWDFGDQTPSVIGSARQTHVYNEVGEYDVSVEILTDEGKREKKNFLIVAREVELQAEFTFYPQQVEAGNKIFFDGTPSQGQISRYYWEFGDGSISRVVKPDHVYERAGTYRVKLEVYDRKNRVSRKEVEIIVSEAGES